MENALYKLEKVTDNPKFEGFGFVRQESLRGDPKSGIGSLTRDFGTDDLKTKGRAWTVPPLAPFWSPQPVVGRVAAFNDYPCVNMLIPVFSRRAVDALRDFLEPNGELLPLVSNIGEYYAYNITTVADILDHSKSQIIWKGEKSVTAFEITRYECFADKMTGFSIFHLVELPSSTMVSQVFVDQVQEHDLQGFHFIKLWPWPEDVSWEEEERKHRKKKTQVKTKRGSKAIKGNTGMALSDIAG